MKTFAFEILHPELPLVKHHFLLSPTNQYLRSKTALVWCPQRCDTCSKRRMHTACNPELAAHTTHRTTPAPDPHQSTLRPLCHLYNAELPPQCLVKLQFRDRLSAQVRMRDQVRITPTDSAQARRCDCRGRARLAKQTGLHATCRRLSIIHAGHMHENSVLAD